MVFVDDHRVFVLKRGAGVRHKVRRNQQEWLAASSVCPDEIRRKVTYHICLILRIAISDLAIDIEPSASIVTEGFAERSLPGVPARRDTLSTAEGTILIEVFSYPAG